MSIGVISDLTKRSIEVAHQYERQLLSSVKQDVAETLDLKPLLGRMARIVESSAVKVQISAAGRQKAAAAPGG